MDFLLDSAIIIMTILVFAALGVKYYTGRKLQSFDGMNGVLTKEDDHKNIIGSIGEDSV